MGNTNLTNRSGVATKLVGIGKYSWNFWDWLTAISWILKSFVERVWMLMDGNWSNQNDKSRMLHGLKFWKMGGCKTVGSLS